MSGVSTLRNNSSLSSILNGDQVQSQEDQENQPPSSENDNNIVMNVKNFIQQTNVAETANTKTTTWPKPRKAASISNLRPIVEDHELSRQQMSPPPPELEPVVASSQYSSLPVLADKPVSPPDPYPILAPTASTLSTFTLKDINLQPQEEPALPESPGNLSILEQSSPRQNPIKLGPYQTRLRYEPNQDFSANDKSSLFLPPGDYGPETNSPPVSIPNTFKYKSHPNAKTKAKLGSEILEEGEGDDEEEEEQHKSTGTADWMPSVLKDKWVAPLSTSSSDPTPNVNSNDLNSSVRITRSQPAIHKTASFPTTMIYNSKVETEETAEWKHAAREYNNKQPNNFDSIFQSLNSNPQKHTQPSVKSTNSSTLSTPIATLSRQMITEQQQQQERVEQSPLKLYRNKYDTFTKKALHGVLENFSNKSNVNTPIPGNSKNPQQDNRPHSVEVPPPPPALKIDAPRPNSVEINARTNIKNFTKDGQYNEEHFKRNADHLFSNLKRGYRASSYNIGQGKSHTTATSTPITNNVRNIEDDNISEYSSFTSGFNSKEDEQDEQNENEVPGQEEKEEEEVNLYTQETLSRSPYENDSEYTFDEDDEEHNTAFTQESPRLSSPHKVNEFLKISKSEYKRLADDNAKLMQLVTKMTQAQEPPTVEPSKPQPQRAIDHSFVSEYDNNIDDVDLFKWKSISQLRLEPTKQQESKPRVVKGHVIPDGNLPMEYPDMIFDKKNMRWQAKKNGEHYTLDSIEDLAATQNLSNDGEFSNQHSPKIISPIGPRLSPAKKKRSSNKLEVSFQLPNSDRGSKVPSPENPGYDVTRTSQLEDMTFTQSHKQLVSIINEVLQGAEHWDRVKSIVLSNYDLENTKDLDIFLPNLQRLVLSNNQIKYLTGIPYRILNLDLSNNNIGDITSFQRLFDLSQVNLSRNSLVRLNNLSHNIHLSELYLAHNSIVSLDGLQDLVKLSILDVSGNKLEGELDLSQFDWPYLQVLNVSDNQLTSITGWEEGILNVLLANDNQLTKFEVTRPNYSLKKLGLKFNNLRLIDIDKLYDLRTLRIDGNKLQQISGLKNLHNIKDISAKSQHPNILSTITNTSPCVSNLDISGNNYYFNSTIFQPVALGAVTKLTICAVDLEAIPTNFAKLFPSVLDLNLNFNKISNISCLSGLKLRKLYLVGNELPRKPSISDSIVGTLYTSLRASRRSLISLDLRMNPLTRDIYPYVISPDELDGPIQIDNVEDIDGFLVHYETIKKTNEFTRRDEEFLKRNQTNGVVMRRAQYEMFCVGMFPGLSKLDGGSLTEPKRSALIEEARVEFQKRKEQKIRKE
ncbi:Septation initiation network scaffold protein cdc11 [Spathaspora sp. JA1]|nr:Septation initiation network scaffold protein cdc11 [Spathaspora sp. JA1]